MEGESGEPFGLVSFWFLYCPSGQGSQVPTGEEMYSPLLQQVAESGTLKKKERNVK